MKLVITVFLYMIFQVAQAKDVLIDDLSFDSGRENGHQLIWNNGNLSFENKNGEKVSSLDDSIRKKPKFFHIDNNIFVYLNKTESFFVLPSNFEYTELDMKNNKDNSYIVVVHEVKQDPMTARMLSYNTNLIFSYHEDLEEFYLITHIENNVNTSCFNSYDYSEEKNVKEDFSLSLNDFLSDPEKYFSMEPAYTGRTFRPKYLNYWLGNMAKAVKNDDIVGLKKLIYYDLEDTEDCEVSKQIIRKFYFSDCVRCSNDIAYYFEKAGYYKEAAELLEAIIKFNPNRTVAYINLGDAYWGLDQKDKAKIAYVKYVELMRANEKESRIPQVVLNRI